MSFRVRIESFEGPFDLLLYLVSRQKVDIGAISIAEITDQYLEEIKGLTLLDLDTASDFLLVASTLLEIKAASLIPSESSDVVEEFQELAPNEARDLLVERLLTYKQFKNAAAALTMRGQAEQRLHARTAGPDQSLLTLMPDYLESVTLDAIALLAANAFGHRDPFLLDSDHIAAKPIPVEVHVRAIHARIKQNKQLRFSELIDKRTEPAVIVVTFLAVLELYKRGMVTARQPENFGDIEIEFIEGSGELLLDGDDAITSDSVDGNYEDDFEVEDVDANNDNVEDDEDYSDVDIPQDSLFDEAQDATTKDE